MILFDNSAFEGTEFTFTRIHNKSKWPNRPSIKLRKTIYALLKWCNKVSEYTSILEYTNIEYTNIILVTSPEDFFDMPLPT